MQRDRYPRAGSLARSSLVVALAIVGCPARSFAQCAARSSSCANCHEQQRARVVNDDGTPWHRDHAFGDFCAGCHGGDRDSAEATQAHLALVDPLGNSPDRCNECHAGTAGALRARYRSARVPAPAAAARPATVRAGRRAPWVDVGLAASDALLAVAGIAFVVSNERRRRGTTDGSHD